MISFDATIVSAAEDQWIYKAIWREGGDGDDEKYLMLQRLKHPTLTERIFGFTKVYIEVCGQGWSWYGQINRFVLSDMTVRVELSRCAAREMVDDGIVEITYRLEPEKRTEWLAIIYRIFDGSKFFEKTKSSNLFFKS